MPRCAYRKIWVIDGSSTPRRAARISLVEIGRRPGAISGPMTPPSSTIVRFGACVVWARTDASSGVPTPANTILRSSSSRAALTASSSEAVYVMSAAELLCRPAPFQQAADPEPLQVRLEGLRPVHVVVQVAPRGVRAA